MARAAFLYGPRLQGFRPLGCTTES